MKEFFWELGCCLLLKTLNLHHEHILGEWKFIRKHSVLALEDTTCPGARFWEGHISGCLWGVLLLRPPAEAGNHPWAPGLPAYQPPLPPNPSPPPHHTHILIGEEVVIFWRCWNPDPSLLWKPRWHFKVGGPYTFLLGGRKANCIFLVALGFIQTQGSITNPRLSGFDGTDLHVKQALTSA